MSAAPVPTSSDASSPHRRSGRSSAAIARWTGGVPPVSRFKRARSRRLPTSARSSSSGPSRSSGDAGQPVHAREPSGARPHRRQRPRRSAGRASSSTHGRDRPRIVVAGESLIDRIVRPDGRRRGRPRRRSVHDGPSPGPARLPGRVPRPPLDATPTGALLADVARRDGVDLVAARSTTDAPTLSAIAALDAPRRRDLPVRAAGLGGGEPSPGGPRRPGCRRTPPPSTSARSASSWSRPRDDRRPGRGRAARTSS